MGWTTKWCLFWVFVKAWNILQGTAPGSRERPAVSATGETAEGTSSCCEQRTCAAAAGCRRFRLASFHVGRRVLWQRHTCIVTEKHGHANYSTLKRRILWKYMLTFAGCWSHPLVGQSKSGWTVQCLDSLLNESSCQWFVHATFKVVPQFVS